MTEKLGLKEVVAMGVGGIVSGGIYAVLGVAIQQAGNAVVISYLLAGIITLLTAYSYVRLTCYFQESGGVFSFIEHTTENHHVAGYFGWILIVGYVGVMALYAFAFGAFTLIALEEIAGLQLPQILRPLLSAGVIGLIAGVNLAGVQLSGLFEDVFVYVKIFVLLTLAVSGIILFDGSLAGLDFFSKGYLSPIAAFAIIFVSYEGFQLLDYDYNAIRNPDKNLRIGIYASILIAIAIYVLVSLMAVLQLTPQQLTANKATALAAAVANIPILGSVGFVLVVISAIKSTVSGINATLFGTSRLAHKIATEDELPRVFSFRNQDNIPTYAVLLMAAATVLLTALGSIQQIAEFGSVAFLVADGAANYANLQLYEQTQSRRWIPAAGLAGTVTALAILLHHLFVNQLTTLLIIAAIFGLVFIIEFFHMESRRHGPVLTT